MKLYLKQSFILSLFLITPSSVVVAADSEFCTDYVLSAIAQYWQGVNNNCSFTGEQWNSDYKGQYSWCLSAHQWVAENETRNRQSLLDECSPPVVAKVISEVKEKTIDTASVDKRSLSIGEEFLRAVADNNVEKAKSLVQQGADMSFQTQDVVLIKELGMTYRKKKSNLATNNEKNSAPTKNEKNSVADNVAKKASEEGNVQESTAVSESALSLAVSRGLVDVGLWLLDENYSSLDEKEISHYKENLLGNALIEAVKLSKVATAEELLKKGAMINYELDNNSGTPLYFAVTKGSLPMCKLLLDRGANPKYAINGGGNMLNLILDKMNLLKLLLEYNGDPNSNGELTGLASLPIIKAVKADNAQAVELLMKHGASADVYDYDVPYPLISAIQNKQIDVIKLLLKYGANVDVIYNTSAPGSCVAGKGNVSPSSAAFETKSDDIITLLKEFGAKSLKSLCP